MRRKFSGALACSSGLPQGYGVTPSRADRPDCPKCYTRPKTNRKFWDKKREDNIARDRRVNRHLRRQGWKVIRIWQHSLKQSPDACLNRIRRALLPAALEVC
jgi:hypothetical protein